MSLIAWDDSFVTGLAEMDAQHKMLVEMINGLHEAHAAGTARDALEDILTGLADYVRQHFETEEAIMLDIGSTNLQALGYPIMESHLRAHVEFGDQVLSFLLDWVQHDANVSDTLLDFLSGWLGNHIKGTDKALAAAVLRFREKTHGDFGTSQLHA